MNTYPRCSWRVLKPEVSSIQDLMSRERPTNPSQTPGVRRRSRKSSPYITPNTAHDGDTPAAFPVRIRPVNCGIKNTHASAVPTITKPIEAIRVSRDLAIRWKASSKEVDDDVEIRSIEKDHTMAGGPYLGLPG